MLIVFKIILVAFAVFGQGKLFPENQAADESSLDSVFLPVDRPELVLAKRAMEAQGLCPAMVKPGKGIEVAGSVKVPESSIEREASDTIVTLDELASGCF